MQRLAQAKIAEMQFDWTQYPETVRFTYQGVGLRYFRDVSFQMVAAINARVDRAGKTLRPTFDTGIGRADRHIEAFKATQGR